ncbi:hypothetical protein Q5752_004111 [Cryptotrichosporon argae]
MSFHTAKRAMAKVRLQPARAVEDDDDDDEPESEVSDDGDADSFDVDAIKFAQWLGPNDELAHAGQGWYYGVMWNGYLKSRSDTLEPLRSFVRDDGSAPVITEFWKALKMKPKPGRLEPSGPRGPSAVRHYECPEDLMRSWLQDTEPQRKYATYARRRKKERRGEPITKADSDYYVRRKRLARKQAEAAAETARRAAGASTPLASLSPELRNASAGPSRLPPRNEAKDLPAFKKRKQRVLTTSPSPRKPEVESNDSGPEAKKHKSSGDAPDPPTFGAPQPGIFDAGEEDEVEASISDILWRGRALSPPRRKMKSSSPLFLSADSPEPVAIVDTADKAGAVRTGASLSLPSTLAPLPVSGPQKRWKAVPTKAPANAAPLPTAPAFDSLPPHPAVQIHPPTSATPTLHPPAMFSQIARPPPTGLASLPALPPPSDIKSPPLSSSHTVSSAPPVSAPVHPAPPPVVQPALMLPVVAPAPAPPLAPTPALAPVQTGSSVPSDPRLRLKAGTSASSAPLVAPANASAGPSKTHEPTAPPPSPAPPAPSAQVPASSPPPAPLAPHEVHNLTKDDEELAPRPPPKVRPKYEQPKKIKTLDLVGDPARLPELRHNPVEAQGLRRRRSSSPTKALKSAEPSPPITKPPPLASPTITPSLPLGCVPTGPRFSADPWRPPRPPAPWSSQAAFNGLNDTMTRPSRPMPSSFPSRPPPLDARGPVWAEGYPHPVLQPPQVSFGLSHPPPAYTPRQPSFPPGDISPHKSHGGSTPQTYGGATSHQTYGGATPTSGGGRTLRPGSPPPGRPDVLAKARVACANLGHDLIAPVMLYDGDAVTGERLVCRMPPRDRRLAIQLYPLSDTSLAHALGSAQVLEWCKVTLDGDPTNPARDQWDALRRSIRHHRTAYAAYLEWTANGRADMHTVVVLTRPEAVAVEQAGLASIRDVGVVALVLGFPIIPPLAPPLLDPGRPNLSVKQLMQTALDITPDSVLSSYAIPPKFFEGLRGKTAVLLPEGSDELYAAIIAAFKSYDVVPYAPGSVPNAVVIMNSYIPQAVRKSLVRPNFQRRTRFYSLGADLRLLPAHWTFRPIWTTGGLVTFSPTFILRSPDKLAEVMDLLRPVPNWGTYIIPSVVEWAEASWENHARCPDPHKAYTELDRALSYDDGQRRTSGAAATRSGGLAVSCRPPSAVDGPETTRWVDWVRTAQASADWSGLVAISRAHRAARHATADLPDLDLLDIETEQLEDLAAMRTSPHAAPYRRYIYIGEMSLGQEARARLADSIELVSVDNFVAILSGVNTPGTHQQSLGRLNVCSAGKPLPNVRSATRSLRSSKTSPRPSTLVAL